MTPSQSTDDLVRGLRWAAARSEVSADNANYLAPVSIAEAEAAADTIERLQRERQLRECVGYMRHIDTGDVRCPAVLSKGWCSCGLDALRARLNGSGYEV